MFKELVHQADLGNGYYQNPILNGDYADPAVFREGDTYYLTVSTGEYLPGLTIFYSKDLVNWELLCHPLRQFEGAAWAPDILKCGNRYYIYFCAGGTNWVIWSDRIDGEWSDPIDLKVGHIDPGHCIAREGKRYLFLSAGHLVPLADDGLSVAGEVRQVVDHWPIPDSWDIEGAFPEAPNVFYKDGYYYLTYADGGTSGPATSHMIISARATQLNGPWELSPYNPVIHTYSRAEKWISKGHGHFVDDPDGNWWVIYHAYENGYAALGRKLLLSRVTFTKDGWFRVETPADVAALKPNGEKVEAVSRLSDGFAHLAMQNSWRTLGVPQQGRYEFTTKGLHVQAADTVIGSSNPLTLITGDHSYEMTVQVKTSGDCEAGLLLLYNQQYFNAVSLKNGVLTVYRLGRVIARKDIGTNTCHLRMKNEEQYLCFYYSTDSMYYQKLNYVIDTTSQNTHAYNGFLSLRPGVFAVGQGEAVFLNCSYCGLK